MTLYLGHSPINLMDSITEAQLASAFVAMLATLDNMIQITSTWNQRLDRVASRLTPTAREVVEEYGSTTQPHRSSIHPLEFKTNVKNKNINKNRDIKWDFFKISLMIKCYKCQDYGHVVVNCPSPFNIAINDGVLIRTPKPDSTIFFRKSLLRLRSLVFFLPLPRLLSLLQPQLSPTFFFLWLYCQHHLLRLLYYRFLLSFSVLVTNPFLLYCRRHPVFPCGIC